MPSGLDKDYDAMLAAITGEGGRVALGEDEQGNVLVTSFPATLPAFFDAFTGFYPDREAVVAGEERIGFPELNALAGRVARALASGFGIQKGDRVGIAMVNSPAWILSYMGVLKPGGVAVLLNGWWEVPELAHALALAEPKLILADEARARKIAEAQPGAGIVPLAVDRPAEEALAPLFEKEKDNAALPEIVPEDDATILFTSGSTARAKGVVSTHRAVTTGVYSFALMLMVLKELIEREGREPPLPRTLINVPLFHVTGEVPVFLNSFVTGRTMVLMSKWDAGEALRLIEQERITYFIGVPTMSLELIEHPEREKYDLSTLTDIAAGGAPRPTAHVARLIEKIPHAQPALGYGLTETNAVGCGNFWSNYPAKPASTGRPFRPFVDLVILDPGGKPLPPGERGEIAIKSAANFRGYWRDPEATAAATTEEGYFRTGDIGYLDEEDYLYIVDRKKDIILRGGENISGQEVEAEIYAHPAVSEAAVFGIADERLGEVPAAVVYSESGVGEEELRDFLDGRIAAYKQPARIWLAETPLPKLGTGKIDKLSLRRRHAAETEGGA
ncbi:MAG: class I adenylate-forming enzyme family protein [Sphingomonadaceae bacterium]